MSKFNAHLFWLVLMIIIFVVFIAIVYYFKDTIGDFFNKIHKIDHVEKKTDNIILDENGRIFPSWVMQNFKKFVLPEIIRKEGEDPCDEKVLNELTLYQQFIGKFLDYRSNYKDLLIYHGLGSGKTVTVINVYN